MKNKNILIAGATSGIGLSLAKHFVQSGDNVIGIARDEDKLREIKSEFANLNGSFNYMSLDLTLSDSLIEIPFTNTVDMHINCVGGVGKFHSSFEEITNEEWLEAYRLNFLTSVNALRLSLKSLKKSLNPLLINISSLAGIRPGKNNPHYGAAKSSLNYLTKYLSQELGKYNIRVVGICPATINDETLKNDAKDYIRRKGGSYDDIYSNFLNEAREKNPLKRIMTSDEIVNLIDSIYSIKSINGTNLILDSGEMK